MSALVARIIAARDRIKPLTRQGEDNVWRPAKDAVEVMADAPNHIAALEEAAKALILADDARHDVQALYERACELARAAIDKSAA